MSIKEPAAACPESAQPTQLTQPTRRNFIGVALAGTAATALPAMAASHATRASSAPRAVDVVIVGAGFAGLTAARKLKQAGVSVVVLEADNRVGGRSKAGMLAGQTVDLGGQWVGPTQKRLLALAQEMGIKTYPQYTDGVNILELAGRQFRYPGEEPPLDAKDLEEFARLMGELDASTAKIDVAAPWQVANAKTLDARTVESWLLAATTSESIRSLFRVFVRAVFCVEPGQLSLLALVSGAAAAGGLGAMVATRGGSQDSLFDGGAWQMAGKMAQALGRAVVLNAPVRAIAQTTERVTVTSDAGVWTAALVVVTVPPPLAARIAYEPPMPPRRDALTQRMAMGSVIKTLVAYKTPFWRAKGLSGQIFSDRTATCMWFDNGAPGHKTGSLVGFFVGGDAQAWADLPAAERRAQVLKDLVSYFGPEAAMPIDYVEQVWAATPWQRGAYMAVSAPGALSVFGRALREPVGRIHWAGTETADHYVGYLDGAIDSGLRATSECLKRLRG